MNCFLITLKNIMKNYLKKIYGSLELWIGIQLDTNNLWKEIRLKKKNSVQLIIIKMNLIELKLEKIKNHQLIIMMIAKGIILDWKISVPCQKAFDA